MQFSLWERGRLSLQLPSHKNIFTGVRQQQPWWATSNRAAQTPHRLSTSEPHLDFSFDPLCLVDHLTGSETSYTVLGTFRVLGTFHNRHKRQKYSILDGCFLQIVAVISFTVLSMCHFYILMQFIFWQMGRQANQHNVFLGHRWDQLMEQGAHKDNFGM